ncbi:MAG: hypothetical protein ACRC0G_14670 [Fusobacteriaceae bacterium]
MKIFEIKEIKSGKVYYVQHKENFCRDFGLTRRLLDRTFHQERNHHKGFVLVDRGVEFIPHEDGDKSIYGTNTTGYVFYIAEEPKEHKEEVENEVIVNLKKTIAELNDKIRHMGNCETDKKYIGQLEKKIQHYMDNNRILRKHKREECRTETVIDKFFEDVVGLMPTLNPHYPQIFSCLTHMEAFSKAMIVNLSDIHFGKKIDMKSNEFNFEIAEKRMNSYADKAIKFANDNDIDTIYITMTGDNFMLGHRRDQLLTQEDNRAVSFVKGFDITRRFFMRFLDEGINLKAVGILGNESRVVDYEFQSNTDAVASESFDYLLFQMLKRHLSDVVEFLNDCDTLNYVFNVNGKCIALTHGDKLKHDYDNVNKFKVRMLEEYGEIPDMVIMGHIHSYLATSTFVRSASLCSGDSYSSNGLNIYGSVASQVMLLIDDDIKAMEVRLD